jgi:putative ABC transport system permease protein
VTLARARAALDVLSRRLQQQYPGTNRGIRFAVLPEAESRVHPMIQRQAFGASVASLGVAALVLLVACSNVAGVLLVRASARRKEIGVRLALGATRARLVRQLLTEHALLSVAGGVIGLMAAHATARVISAARLPSSVALGLDLDVDGRVLVFVASVTIVTALVFGLAPALDGTKFDLLSLMKDGDHAEAPRQSRLRSLLVSSQVAVAVLLLMACGLFFRNLQHAHRIDIGFTPDAVVMTSMDLGMQNYSAERAREFWSKLNDRLEVLPGVESAGLANQVPFEPRIGAVSLAPEGYTPPGDGSWPLLRYNVAGPRYFSTMRIALVDGREFTDRDDDAAPKVVIVNDVAARQFWADGRAVGRRVTDKSGRLFEVVGIARRGRYLTLGEDPQPYMYFPLGQRDMRDGTIVARGAGDPQALLKQLDSVVHSLDAGLPLYNVKTLSEHVEVALMPAKTGAATLTVVGLVAVLLTSLGLYGTVGYAVSRRTYEIGVRRALGAQDADVARLVVRDAAALVLAGAVCGGLLAIVEARLLQRFLYGANAIDPFAAGLAATVLAIVCIGAAWVPTRRAIRVSAATALRYQ